MQVLYFAWLRQAVGVGEESIAPPEDVRTVGALVTWLAGRSEGHAKAFATLASVRCAVNQDFATPDTPIAPDDEVAFFPPVTGG